MKQLLSKKLMLMVVGLGISAAKWLASKPNRVKAKKLLEGWK
jgi:hypothetical protein